MTNTIRSDGWTLRTKRLSFGSRPVIMGIVNVTPDSFSDGGKFFDPQTAVEHGLQLVQDGAGILDIGGESTRPYSDSVPVRDELARVIPVIEKLAASTDVPISIDTSKAIVAREAVAAGAEIINDVTGLEGDPEMLSVAQQAQAGICAMHMQGTPQTMQDAPSYDDVVEDIFRYLQARRDALLSAGIAQERICLDPGIGFGKTHEHNLQLLQSSDRFHQLGCPVLVGHSRKGFIAHLLDDRECERMSGTVGAALGLATQGIQIIRVHDVAELNRALILFQQTFPDGKLSR
ncbi:MAG: dihydropteroate synthase [Planctomycetota bacterium]|nr:dihydropteroate synthase [Planctomycetota bacterium]